MADELESLSTDEPLAARIRRHDFDRLIMLSDGVFSIAMTLLVLDVKPADGPEPLMARLVLPVSAFAISFAVAAIFWVTHKRLFARLRAVDGRLTLLVLLFLGLIALLPAVTSLIYRTENSLEANEIYLGLTALIGLSQAAAWAYTALKPGLMNPDFSIAGRWNSAVGSLVMPLAMTTLGLYAGYKHSLVAIATSAAIGAALILIRRRLGRLR